MGIPYSKQINAAFDEVTPLVAAGFSVLETSKNISILLAAVQILTVLLLFCILIVLMALLVAINPDLQQERKELVTPAAKWVVGWILNRSWLRILVLTLVLGSTIGGAAGWYATRDMNGLGVELDAVAREREAEEEVTS